MKYRTIFLFLMLPFLFCGCSEKTAGAVQETAPAISDVFAMDTYMNLKVWCPDGETVLKQAENLIYGLENTLSVTNPDSDTGKINQNSGLPVKVSEDTVCLIQEAQRIGRESNGALDITIYPVLKEWGFTVQEYHIPDSEKIKELLAFVDNTQIQADGDSVTVPKGFQLDFGAVAKGYTGDRLIQLFQEYQAESAIVSLGGNVQALGRKTDGTLWKVAVVNPFQPSENMCILEIENQAVITSGTYERYFIGDDDKKYWHILDPKTGFPAKNGLVSVTVIGESGLLCDALSTALFVEGTERQFSTGKQPIILK